MGQLFVGYGFLAGTMVMAWNLHREGFQSLETAIISLAVGMAIAVFWLYSPFPNASVLGTGQTTGGGYWGFKKNDQ